METMQITESNTVISSTQLLEHWQGHRKLTRKMIEAFPEDKLFSYAIGGMRPFAELVMEMIDLAGGGIEGAATGEWPQMENSSHITRIIPASKEEILNQWDKVTVRLNLLWPHITPARFQEMDKAFGQYEGTIFSTLLYFIDNEVHHRGQGYVYLRSLGITPPPFWERW
ncbi:DinB family protein [Mucilaginibacter sp. PAMB04274]|uniref:DinB family protein n=1 Tax=Mucilaginibacter sp. PAMB04274 TaxID=3138568 RepID=UPI0031F6A055